jgi:hypothetical protein
LLIVAEDDRVGWLGVEAGVLRLGAVRDPALDDQVATHFVRVVLEVVSLVGHACDC